MPENRVIYFRPHQTHVLAWRVARTQLWAQWVDLCKFEESEVEPGAFASAELPCKF